MASNRVERKWTVDEYLAYEADVEIKHEYIDGEIYAMSGGTRKHSLVIMNLSVAIGRRLIDSPCHAYPSDLRVKINDLRYVYPDLSAICGDEIFMDENETTLTNPTLVVEVMSPSSEKYDTGMKSEMYRSLKSLQAYLTVDQSRVFVQLYTRQDDGWLLQEFDKRDQIIPLPMIKADLPLSEVYRDIVFDSNEDRSDG